MNGLAQQHDFFQLLIGKSQRTQKFGLKLRFCLNRDGYVQQAAGGLNHQPFRRHGRRDLVQQIELFAQGCFPNAASIDDTRSKHFILRKPEVTDRLPVPCPPWTRSSPIPSTGSCVTS